MATHPGILEVQAGWGRLESLCPENHEKPFTSFKPLGF